MPSPMAARRQLSDVVEAVEAARAAAQQASDALAESILGVGLGELHANRLEHLGHGEGGRPRLLKQAEADLALLGDVGVVDGRLKCDFGRLERVVVRNGDGDVQLSLRFKV